MSNRTAAEQEIVWSTIERIFQITRLPKAQALIFKHDDSLRAGVTTRVQQQLEAHAYRRMNFVNLLYAKDLCLFEVNVMSYQPLDWPDYWAPHPVRMEFLSQKHSSTGHIFFTPAEVDQALRDCKHLVATIDWNKFTEWPWLEQQVRKPLEDMQIDDVRRVCGPFAELIMVLRDQRLEPTWRGDRDTAK